MLTLYDSLDSNRRVEKPLIYWVDHVVKINQYFHNCYFHKCITSPSPPCNTLATVGGTCCYPLKETDPIGICSIGGTGQL